MKRCEFCDTKSPDNAQFCGNCGHILADNYATVTDITNPEGTVSTEPQTPPLFSSPMHPNLQDSGMGWQDTDFTFLNRRSFENMESGNPQFIHSKTDENEPVLPEALLPGILAMQGKMPSAAQTPMVQGSPQVGGVPSVQGTPAAPGNVPQSIAGQAHGAASSAPSYAPQEAQYIPIHHQQEQYQPVHHQRPVTPSREQGAHHHPRPLHNHSPHSSKLHHPAAASSKAGMGVVTKWLIVTIAALVIIASSSIFLAHALMPGTPPPALTLSGTNVVRGGDNLHLHGQGFQPGDGVTLTIDNGLPVSLAGQRGTQTVSQATERNAQVPGLSQMNIAGALQPHSASGTNITVSSTGTFDANVTVPPGLSAGKHTIHATDNQSSQRASLQFTIPSPRLAVNPTSLNFGSVEVGRTVKLSVTLSNQGGASVLWTSTVEGSSTNWLTLSKSSEVIGTNSLGESIIVTANTNNLSVGPHSVTLRFHSTASDVQVTVKINVVSIGQGTQQAILNVPQQSLDFGQLPADQKGQQSIAIANLGNLALQWHANTDDASATWLSLATTKGTVQPGAAPQMVQVNVDTTGLMEGSYSGTIQITSNGGNAQIGVTLVVTGSTSTPTVTGIRPSSGPVAGGTALVITGTGFTGATSVSFGQKAASNVSVKSDTQITATSPAGSGTVDVTVTTPSGTSATSSADQFTYIATPPPTATVTAISPASGPNNGGTKVTITGTGFTGATSVSFGETAASNVSVKSDTQITATSPAGSDTVDVTVTTPGGTSKTSSADHFTYTVPTPTVTAISPTSGPSTGATSVTITGTGFTGATSVSFGETAASNFKVASDTQITATSPAGSDTVDVTVTTATGTSTTSTADHFTYTVPTPNWSVNPTSLNASTCGVTKACTVTLTEDAQSTGDIAWSASSNVGATFKPSKGTLSPDGQITVSILAPCQSDTFTFTGSGGVKPLTVAWTCSVTQTPPTPKITVTPQKLDPTACKQNSDGTYNCAVTVGETSPGSLTWFAPTGVGGTNVTFDPPSGQLTTDQTQQTEDISSIPCSSTSFTFTDQNNNAATVVWNCTPPTPTPTPVD